MSASGLGSRAIIGTFFKALEQDTGASWVSMVSMLFSSDQESETYKWLGDSPAMREWVGGRNAKGFRDNGLTIVNKAYEATIEVLLRDLQRDKTGQVMKRIAQLAERANSHWASLLSTLILNGTSTVCYDGQFFFDTDHEEGLSGSQSNDITTDISALAATVHGSVTVPSVEEMQQAIFKSITTILGFKDDQGEPMNEGASRFLVMVPSTLFIVASNAVKVPGSNDVNSQHIPSNFLVDVVMNPRLTGTDDFYTFRTDSTVAAFIRQEEEEVSLKAKADGSEFEFDNKAHQYGIDASRNVGYGYWQNSCYNQMV